MTFQLHLIVITILTFCRFSQLSTLWKTVLTPTVWERQKKTLQRKKERSISFVDVKKKRVRRVRLDSSLKMMKDTNWRTYKNQRTKNTNDSYHLLITDGSSIKISTRNQFYFLPKPTLRNKVEYFPTFIIHEPDFKYSENTRFSL